MCSILRIRDRGGPRTMNEVWADAYHVWLHWDQPCCKDEQAQMKIDNPKKYKVWEDIANSWENKGVL